MSRASDPAGDARPDGGGAWGARVQSLRDAFDRAFSEAPPAGVALGASRFLGLRIAGDPFALPMTDVARLHGGGAVVPIPSPSSTLLGIASVRGTLIAVHDLHVLLGYPAGGPRRYWVLVRRRDHPVGLAVDGVDGQFEADAAGPAGAGGGAARYTRGATRTGAAIRPIVDVASILAALARTTSGKTPARE